MDTLAFPLELKEVSDKGEFTGFASVYGNEDLQGDIVQPGAFTGTLRDNAHEIPILYQHDPSQPIGMGRLEDMRKGLRVSGQLNMDVERARESLSLMRPQSGFKKTPLKGLSIGYGVKEFEWEGQTRLLKQVDLYEVSLVTFPANPRALVTSAKDRNVMESLSKKVGVLEGMHIEQRLKVLEKALWEEGLLDDPEVLRHMERAPSGDSNEVEVLPDLLNTFRKDLEKLALNEVKSTWIQ